MEPAASTTDVCPNRPTHGAASVRLVHVTPAAHARQPGRWAEPHTRARGRRRAAGRAINTALAMGGPTQPRGARTQPCHTRKCLRLDVQTQKRSHTTSRMHRHTHTPTHARARAHKRMQRLPLRTRVVPLSTPVVPPAVPLRTPRPCSTPKYPLRTPRIPSSPCSTHSILSAPELPLSTPKYPLSSPLSTPLSTP
jgi:hypothetical protein